MRGLTVAEYKFLKQAADPFDHEDAFAEIDHEVSVSLLATGRVQIRVIDYPLDPENYDVDVWDATELGKLALRVCIVTP